MSVGAAEYRARAAELLAELGATEWGQVAAALIDWGRRQIEAERHDT